MTEGRKRDRDAGQGGRRGWRKEGVPHLGLSRETKIIEAEGRKDCSNSNDENRRRRQQEEVRERYTTINHNDEAIEHLHMKRVPGKPLRERKKEQWSVRSIIVDQLRFHNKFQALTIQQPAKL
jgi:hypothetical protein